MEPTKPKYRWSVVVKQFNLYGDSVVARTPTTVLAADKAELTQKVRSAFNATYDNFRGFWSHSWVLDKVEEVDQ